MIPHIMTEKIENRTQLKMKIMELHARAFEQETQIAHRFREMSYLIQPAMLLKRFINDFNDNPETKSDLLHAGKNLVLNMISNAWFRNRKGIGSAVVFMVLKRVLVYVMQRRSRKRLQASS
ncbi:MAG TPA: hypothetical protein VE978_18480 [Chitinophagales bacterium]|nr:hypothetical protein [Chitinophagales bacterium]